MAGQGREDWHLTFDGPGVTGGYPHATGYKFWMLGTNFAEIVKERKPYLLGEKDPTNSQVEALLSGTAVRSDRAQTLGKMLVNGDVVLSNMSGSPGLGDPLERDPEAVVRGIMHSGDFHPSVLYSSSPGEPVNNQGSLRPARIFLVSWLFLVAHGFDLWQVMWYFGAEEATTRCWGRRSKLTFNPLVPPLDPDWAQAKPSAPVAHGFDLERIHCESVILCSTRPVVALRSMNPSNKSAIKKIA